MLISQTLFANATAANGMLLPASRRGRWRNSNLWGCRRGYRQRGRRPIRHFDQGRCPISGLPPASQDVAFGIVILIAVALTADRAKIGIVK
jgi:ribose transport system permease protein